MTGSFASTSSRSQDSLNAALWAAITGPQVHYYHCSIAEIAQGSTSNTSLPTAMSDDEMARESLRWMTQSIGLSLRQTGQALGVSHNAVAKWLRGAPLPIARRRHIAVLRRVLEERLNCVPRGDWKHVLVTAPSTGRPTLLDECAGVAISSQHRSGRTSIRERLTHGDSPEPPLRTRNVSHLIRGTGRVDLTGR